MTPPTPQRRYLTRVFCCICRCLQRVCGVAAMVHQAPGQASRTMQVRLALAVATCRATLMHYPILCTNCVIAPCIRSSSSAKQKHRWQRQRVQDWVHTLSAADRSSKTAAHAVAFPSRLSATGERWAWQLQPGTLHFLRQASTGWSIMAMLRVCATGILYKHEAVH